MTTAEKMATDQDTGDGPKIRSAKRSAFWGGILDGLSGPLLMALELKVPVPGTSKGDKVLVKGRYIPASKEYASWTAGQREFAHALMRASEAVAEKKGLISHLVREKRLDPNGKMRNVERTAVRHRLTHGEPQE